MFPLCFSMFPLYPLSFMLHSPSICPSVVSLLPSPGSQRCSCSTSALHQPFQPSPVPTVILSAFLDSFVACSFCLFRILEMSNVFACSVTSCWFQLFLSAFDPPPLLTPLHSHPIFIVLQPLSEKVQKINTKPVLVWFFSSTPPVCLFCHFTFVATHIHLCLQKPHRPTGGHLY